MLPPVKGYPLGLPPSSGVIEEEDETQPGFVPPHPLSWSSSTTMLPLLPPALLLPFPLVAVWGKSN
jgi:hypothetical protein